MAGDFTKVVTTEAYATLLATIDTLIKDMAKGFDPALSLGTLNFPTNVLRWSSTSKRWELYNGSAWVDNEPTGGYAINISGSSSKWGTGRTITLTGDATGTSGAFDGSGNLSFAVTLATVPATKGGTDQTAYTVGDMLYASSTSALSKLADVATGNALISGGVGVAPSWGKIGLTTHVSGTLPVGNGGTGGTTASGARTALGLAIGTDVMGMGGGTFTGAIAAPNLSGTNTGDEPAASTTVAGVSEYATDAETLAMTSTTRSVTPAGLGSLGGILVAFTKITATNATWTPNAKTNRIVVRVRAGGGAGSGSTGGNDGHGGKAGAEKWGVSTSVSGTYAATIGAGGVGAAVGTYNEGSDSSFIGTGLSVTANGGRAGYPSISNYGQPGASGDDVGGAGRNTGGAGNSAPANSGAGGGAAYGAYAGGSGGSGVIDIWEFA